MHDLCNQIYIKPASTWDHSIEKITFFCLSIKFYIIILVGFFVCWFVFSCLHVSPTVKFSYRSYWLKKNNSPRVSHFSLALQISSLERKKLFEITGANKKYFNVKYFTIATLVSCKSQFSIFNLAVHSNNLYSCYYFLKEVIYIHDTTLMVLLAT